MQLLLPIAFVLGLLHVYTQASTISMQQERRQDNCTDSNRNCCKKGCVCPRSMLLTPCHYKIDYGTRTSRESAPSDAYSESDSFEVYDAEVSASTSTTINPPATTSGDSGGASIVFKRYGSYTSEIAATAVSASGSSGASAAVHHDKWVRERDDTDSEKMSDSASSTATITTAPEVLTPTFFL